MVCCEWLWNNNREKLCDKGGNQIFLSDSSQESVSAPMVARIRYSPRMTLNWICRRKRTDRWIFDYFGYFISVISGFGSFHVKSSNFETLCSSISGLPKNWRWIHAHTFQNKSNTFQDIFFLVCLSMNISKTSRDKSLKFSWTFPLNQGLSFWTEIFLKSHSIFYWRYEEKKNSQSCKVPYPSTH